MPNETTGDDVYQPHYALKSEVCKTCLNYKVSSKLKERRRRHLATKDLQSYTAHGVQLYAQLRLI